MSDQSVVLEFDADERAFFDDLAAKGHPVTVVAPKKFDAKQVIDVIVAVAPSVINLIVAFLQNRKKKSVKIDGTTINYEGYSADEIEKLLRK